MKSLYLTLIVGVLSVSQTSLLAQEPTLSASPTVSQNTGSSQTNAPVAGPQQTGPTEPDIAVMVSPPKPELGTPTLQSLNIYKKNTGFGILRLKGAEITLPNVLPLLSRSINVADGYIDVSDVYEDGTTSVTSWDTTALTTPFMPRSTKPGGAYNNVAVVDDPDDPDAPSNAAIADLLPGEKPTTYTYEDPSLGPVTTRLGSFFVDDSNRIFFAPPTGAKVFATPSDVNAISCVTHVSKNNNIVAEWTKSGENGYHVVTINIDSLSVIQDFVTDATDESQMILTWVNNNSLLGRLNGRGFSEYTTINLSTRAYTAKASTSSGELQTVRNAAVNTYTITPSSQ